MSKIYIDGYSWTLLNEWSKSNKWKVINALPYYSSTTIYLKEYLEYDGFFAKKKYGYKFRIRENKRQICVGTVTIDEKSENDVSINFKLSNGLDDRLNKDLWENISVKIKTFVDVFLCANAFLWYGNLADEKKLIAQGKNLESSKVIIFRPYKENLYAVPINQHRSPEGIFEVRGHFRKYKSGKIIWIDSYIKGIEK